MLCRIILILITPNLQLDTLLFQLHTLSFFLSPSLLGFISRPVSQFQCSKPRDIDPSRSLRLVLRAWCFSTSGAFGHMQLKAYQKDEQLFLISLDRVRFDIFLAA